MRKIILLLAVMLMIASADMSDLFNKEKVEEILKAKEPEIKIKLSIFDFQHRLYHF